MYIYDGPNDQSTLIDQYSGNSGTFTVSSTGNSILVKFQSDSSVNESGFLANIHYGIHYFCLKFLNNKYNFFYNFKFKINIFSIVNCTTVSKGEIGFCNCNPCSADDFDSDVDCCYLPTVCTTINPCGQDEGHCDFDNQCKDHFYCGSNNCPASFGYGNDVNCCTCYGDSSCCTTENPCKEDGGDCDSNDDCEEGLLCSVDSNCQFWLNYGLDSNDECCYKPCEGSNCCTSENPCDENQGDCDFDNHCKSGLRCGVNNCPNNSTFAPTDDCCTSEPCNGGADCCSTQFLCDEGEGDCDDDDECKPGLECGSNNCPTSHGVVSGADCCTP